MHQPLRIIEPLGNRRPFGGGFAGQRHFARAHLAAVLAVGGDQENPVVPRDRIAHRNVHIHRAQRVRAGIEEVQLAEPDHRGAEQHDRSVYGKARFDLRKIPVVQRHGAHVQLMHALKAGFVIANDDLFQRAAEVFKDRAALVESEPLSDHVRAAVQHEPRLFARRNGQPVRIQRAVMKIAARFGVQRIGMQLTGRCVVGVNGVVAVHPDQVAVRADCPNVIVKSVEALARDDRVARRHCGKRKRCQQNQNQQTAQRLHSKNLLFVRLFYRLDPREGGFYSIFIVKLKNCENRCRFRAPRRRTQPSPARRTARLHANASRHSA